MHNRALMTSGGLRKKDLTYNNKNCIVSKRASNRAKKDMRLQKAGFITTKGEFKLFNKQTGGAIERYLQYVQMAIKGTRKDKSSYKRISTAHEPAAATLAIEQKCICKIKKKFEGKSPSEIKGVLYSPHERWKDEQKYNSLLAVAVWSGRNKIVETILDLMLKVNPQKQKDKEYIEAWKEGLKVANKNLTDIIELLNNEKYKPDIGNSFEQIASNEAMARGNIPPNPLIPNLKYMFSSNNTSKPLENTSYNEEVARQLRKEYESELSPAQLAKQKKEKNARRIHERNNQQDKLYGRRLVQQYHLHSGTLKNIGNSCFANSVFQLLYSMDDFRNIIITANVSRLDTRGNIVLYCIQQIFKNLEQNIKSFDIETIILDFGTYGRYTAAQLLYGYSKLEIYKQHDPSEFMNYILDMLLDSQVKDAISKLFRITLENNKTYRNKTTKLTPVIENYIACGIKDLDDRANINSTIIYFQQNEITDNRNKRLSNNIIKKNIKIKIDPEQKYLIIRLKRESYNRTSSIPIKLVKDVCLNDYITIDSTHFKLKGFIIHIGDSPSGGHYVYVHHISSENRILYNDGIYRKYKDAQYNHRQNTVLVLYEKTDHIVHDDGGGAGAGAGAAAQINLPAGHPGPTNLTRNEIRQLFYSTIQQKQQNPIYKLKFNRYKIAFPSKPDKEIDELVMSEILK